MCLALLLALTLLVSCSGSSDDPTGPTNQPPTISTAGVSAITQTTAQGGGNITSDGGAAVTVRGVCWSTNASPTIANSKTSDGVGTGTFISSITGLSANTTYYVRAYATNSVGTGYGTAVEFTTPSLATTVTDVDGNIYQTVTIGTQVWMAENLKVIHYRNGDGIRRVGNPVDWGNSFTGAYCEYGNMIPDAATYGRLYNWYAVNDARNLAPAGWHVATDEDWKTLETFLGMSFTDANATGIRGTDQGGKLKEVGTTHWTSPNIGATNVSGFTALPAGNRTSTGDFVGMNGSGIFWTSSAINTNPLYRSLSFNNQQIGRHISITFSGYSVRCVKD